MFYKVFNLSERLGGDSWHPPLVFPHNGNLSVTACVEKAVEQMGLGDGTYDFAVVSSIGLQRRTVTVVAPAKPTIDQTIIR